MAVYYKFKSAKNYDTIPIIGHYISVANLKDLIFESKRLGKGKDFDLIITHAQTNEEYRNDDNIPRNTSVLVRRIPGLPCKPIVCEPKEKPKIEDAQPQDSNTTAVLRYPGEAEWDEFVKEFFEDQKVPSAVSGPDDSLLNKDDEDSKIKALVETSALNSGAVRSFGKFMGEKLIGGRSYGYGGLTCKTPPEGYVCHRCKIPGHFIQHCPTNGDASYDIKRVKPPTGIPKSMLMANSDGSYSLPSGEVAVLKPNEAAFDKEMEGITCTRMTVDIPSALCCPLCREVMKDAVFTKTCCFESFCDKCIRDHIISKSMCFCRATNVLADDLIPNMTLRSTIISILESSSKGSSTNTGSSLTKQGTTESAHSSLPKAPSPTLSATSEREKTTVPLEGQPAITFNRFEPKQEAAEPKEQSRASPVEEKVQQKQPASEPGIKKKMKKPDFLPANDLIWGTSMAAKNYMMPSSSSAYHPYWGSVQLGMDGYMSHFNGATPYMGYVPNPYDNHLGGFIPQAPFGCQGYPLPAVPPPSASSACDMGPNQALPPLMGNEEYKERKSDLKRKRESGRRDKSKEYYEDHKFSRGTESRSEEVSYTKPKHVDRHINSQQSDSSDIDERRHHQQARSERFSGGAQRRAYDDELSDNGDDDSEKNFKRRRSWYDNSSRVYVEANVKANQSASREDRNDFSRSREYKQDYERCKTWGRERTVLV